MTKVVKVKVKCIKCGETSDQIIVQSVNFNLGKKEDNEKLLNHQQVCPNCGYTSFDISFDVEKK